MKLSDGCFRLSSFYNHFEKKSKAIIKTLNSEFVSFIYKVKVVHTNALIAVFSGYI